MKTIFSTLFVFLFTIQIQAQMISLATDPATIQVSSKALNWENQKLRSDLGLEPEQFEKIKGITLERAKARALVTQMFSLEPEKQEVRIKEIESQYDAEFSLVLTENQYKKYLKLNGRTELPEEVEVVKAPEPEGPNFNDQIQAMIAKATAPVIDPALIPQQDSTQSKFELLADSADISALEGLDFKISNLNDPQDAVLAGQPNEAINSALQKPATTLETLKESEKGTIVEGASEIDMAEPKKVSAPENQAPGLNLNSENILVQP